MVFALTEEQQMIRENVLRICADFGDDYWLARDEDGRFPEDFCLALAEAGYLGIAMPEDFGGSGLGITEAAILANSSVEEIKPFTSCMMVAFSSNEFRMLLNMPLRLCATWSAKPLPLDVLPNTCAAPAATLTVSFNLL